MKPNLLIKSRIFVISAGIALGFLAVGCGKTPPMTKAKKDSGGANGLTGPAIPEVINFMNARFVTKATALGMDACNGTVAFQVNVSANQGATNQLFKIPEGRLKCSGLAGNMGDNGEIDLAKMMGGFAAAPPAGTNPIEIIDNVISMTALGNSTYVPARPFLPAFVSATPDQLRSLNISRQLSVTDNSKGKTSTGVATLQVQSVGGTYRPPQLNIGHEFKNVIIYELKHQGFDNIQVMNNMLWDRFKMWISLEPFAILRIEMAATVADAIDSSADPAAGNQQIDTMVNTFVGGAGNLIFGPQIGGLLGSLAGPLVTNMIKNGQIQVEMDITEMDKLQEMIDRIGTGNSRPSSGGQTIQ